MAEPTNPSDKPDQSPKAKKASKSNIPKADADLSTTIGSVSVKWMASPQITMVWKSSADFKTMADLLISTIDLRNETGSVRPGITTDLFNVNTKLNKGVSFIKRYLASDFGDDANAQYSKFGIVKIGSGYGLPNDMDKRKDSLKLMLAAIAAAGFDAKLYGKAYFTPLITEFNALASSARSTDESVSGHVGNKKALKAEVKEVLTSLINILKGNYPKTWNSVLREWGFHKEKY